MQGTKGDVHQFVVNPGLQISNLKDDVRKSFGIPSYSLVRLVYDGVQLFDRQKIGECLQNGAAINMTSNADGASVASMQRLLSEYKLIRDTKPPNISIQPPRGNIFLWKGIILGPSKSAWAGGVFPIEVRFPQDYPTHAPEVYFVGTMFHPNVYTNGRVCISTLAGDYESSHSVISLLTAIQSMLPEPNVKSIANGEAGNMFMSDIVQYHKKVRGIVGCV